MKTETLTIGRLADRADINIESVRYYERVGLIRQPRKPVSGYRQYPVELVERIRFVKRAQAYGFSLHEIKDLLKIGDGRCHDVQQKAIEKRDYINNQINDLKKLVQTLDQLIEACDLNQSNSGCPIVKTFSQSPTA